MPMKEESDFHVDRLKKVDEEMTSLAEKAASLGIRKELVQSLKTVVEQLRTRPLDWGDPVRRTRKKGGLVCRGVLPLLVTHYVVFEAERAVCILSIRPFPGSPLE
jgi:hypothetical protein